MAREKERWGVPPLCTTRSEETNQPKINLWSCIPQQNLHISISMCLIFHLLYPLWTHLCRSQKVTVLQRNTFSCCFHFQYSCQRDSEERRKERLCSSSGQLKPKAIIRNDYWAWVLQYTCSHSLTFHRTPLLSSDHVVSSNFLNVTIHMLLLSKQLVESYS